MMLTLPAVTPVNVYTPVVLVVVDPPLHFTVAPDKAPPVETLVILPVTVPVPVVTGVSVKLAVLVAPPVTVTFCVRLWKPVAEATS